MWVRSLDRIGPLCQCVSDPICNMSDGTTEPVPVVKATKDFLLYFLYVFLSFFHHHMN